MAELIVDLLEVVEIDHPEGKTTSGTTVSLHPILNRAIEAATIGDLSQGIQHGILLGSLQTVLQTLDPARQL